MELIASVLRLGLCPEKDIDQATKDCVSMICESIRLFWGGGQTGAPHPSFHGLCRWSRCAMGRNRAAAHRFLPKTAFEGPAGQVPVRQFGETDAEGAMSMVPLMRRGSPGGVYLECFEIIRNYAGGKCASNEAIHFISNEAGSLTFTFPTNVTGISNIIQPTPSSSGITTSGLVSNTGKTITVTGVPEVGISQFICITLPVPVGTVPNNIVVSNQPEDGSSPRSKTVSGSSTGLTLGGGCKLIIPSFN